MKRYLTTLFSMLFLFSLTACGEETSYQEFVNEEQENTNNSTNNQNDESMTAEHHIYNLIFQGRGLLETERDQFSDVTIDPEQMVEILFTSGTTGTPKGVMLSNKNICHVIRGANQVINLKKDDRALSVLPIHHTLESSMGILAVLFQGGSVAFCEGLKYMLKNMRESEASLIVGVPLIIESMYSKIWKEAEKNGSENAMLKAVRLNRRLMTFKIDKRKKIFSGVRNRFGGNFRYLISGAAAIDPAVLRGFIDLGFDVSQGYGLTETAPLVTVIPDFENAYKKSGSVGLAIPGVEIKIDQPDEDGIGEILIKGANVMMGYYNMPEETAEVIKDGWLHSGDLGFMDPDGWLYITGRSRNIIVTKTGKNIYPEEIEAVIRNLDYVVDCMVYGVKEKNEEEYRITVQIFPDYEALEKAKGNMTDDEIFELFKEEIYQMNRKLASYKRVKDIISPISYGGGQEFGFRPGTENVAGIVGLGAAAHILMGCMREEITQYELMSKMFIKHLRTYGCDFQVNFENQNRVGNILSL